MAKRQGEDTVTCICIRAGLTRGGVVLKEGDIFEQPAATIKTPKDQRKSTGHVYYRIKAEFESEKAQAESDDDELFPDQE
jgi:hypothetical protein